MGIVWITSKQVAEEIKIRKTQSKMKGKKGKKFKARQIEII